MPRRTKTTEEKPAAAAAEQPAPAPEPQQPAPPPPTQEPESEEPEEPPQAGALARRQLERDDAMVLAFKGLIPSSIGEAMEVARFLARSGAIPAGLRGQPETVFTVIMAGMELGLTPIRAIKNIVNIKGNLAMAAALQLALVRRSGVLAYFDEGFELAAQTDRNLKDRALDHDLILKLVKAQDIPAGKPYGWCTMKRKGDPGLTTRVFSWVDAERFIYNARDDEDGGGGSGSYTKKKLSEKSNYVNTPQDMYPKRARTRVIDVLFSDVTAGLPAVEALDGVVLEGEVVSSERVPVSSEDRIGSLLGAIRLQDASAATSIEAGFEQLKMGIAKRLQKLTEFQGNPTGLMEWLKTEWANRRSGRAERDVLSGAPAAPDAKQPSKTTTTAAPEPPPEPAAHQNPDRQARGGGMESVKSVADRFKASVPRGSF